MRKGKGKREGQKTVPKNLILFCKKNYDVRAEEKTYPCESCHCIVVRCQWGAINVCDRSKLLYQDWGLWNTTTGKG